MKVARDEEIGLPFQSGCDVEGFHGPQGVLLEKEDGLEHRRFGSGGGIPGTFLLRRKHQVFHEAGTIGIAANQVYAFIPIADIDEMSVRRAVLTVPH